ncbi:SCO family protein [Qipengyuania sp. SM2507]
MRRSSIRVSDSYEISPILKSAWGKADHVYGHSQVAPDELGGHFDYTDWRGQPVSQQNFLGRWTLLYFGYSRCRGSCRRVAPLIAGASAQLRKMGLPAKAAFIDIETQPVSLARMQSQSVKRHIHANNWPMRFAMSQLYADNHGQLEVMTGNRAQLARATAAFHVMREHVPPRSGEDVMSINHSSLIYLLGRDTFVAAYGYHDMTKANIIALVEKLSDAERIPINYSAARSRYIQGSCGVEES